MIAPRETIWNAVQTLLANALVPGVCKQVSRRLIPFDQVAQQSMPAVFIDETFEEYKHEGPAGKPPVQILHADLYIYGFQADQNTATSSIINPVLDGIDAAIFQPEGGPYTGRLNGLVTKMIIRGAARLHEAAQSGNIVVVAPLDIVATV